MPRANQICLLPEGPRPRDPSRGNATKRWAAPCLAAWLSACAQATDPEPVQPVTAAQVPAPSPWPAGVQALLPEMLADAARRSGVPVDRLRVESARAVTWPDGSLGCPEPGLLYPQVLVPGWHVVVAVAGAAPLAYHASRRGEWLWCPAERATPALPGSPGAST